MTPTDWLATATAGLVSLLAPYFIRPILVRLSVIDQPSARSSHSMPTIRGAGLAVLLGVLAGTAVVVATGNVDQIGHVVLAAALATAAATVGWFEDLRGVRIADRVTSQVAMAAAAGGIVWLLTGSVVWAILGVAVIAVYINVANFMDGINGISGLHGFAVGTAYAILGARFEQEWMVVLGSILAVSFLAFLPWNLGSKRMFLGDVGSYLLGGFIAIIAVLGLAEGIPPVAIVAPVAIYLADTVFTLTLRVMRRDKWHESHRSHNYHLLEDRGLSHIQIATLVTGAGTLTGVLGALSPGAPWWGQVGCVGGILLVCVLYLSLPGLMYRMKAAPSDVAEREPAL